MRYRDFGTNLGKHLERIVKHAGLIRWPRLWHALRASRATELADRFLSHVAAEWLGHTEEIASRSYRSVTREHLAMARVTQGVLRKGPETGGIALQMRCHRCQKETEKTSVSLSLVGQRVTRATLLLAPTVRPKPLQVRGGGLGLSKLSVTTSSKERYVPFCSRRIYASTANKCVQPIHTAYSCDSTAAC